MMKKEILKYLKMAYYASKKQIKCRNRYFIFNIDEKIVLNKKLLFIRRTNEL